MKYSIIKKKCIYFSHKIAWHKYTQNVVSHNYDQK